MKSLGNPRFSNFSDFSKMTRLMTKNYTILLLDIVIFFLSLKKVQFILKQISFCCLLIKLSCVLPVGAKSGWCICCCEISRHLQ